MNKIITKMFSFLVILYALGGGYNVVSAHEAREVHTEEKQITYIKYEAPDMDLSSATGQQLLSLQEIGWNLESEIPFLLVDDKGNPLENSTESNIDIKTINLSELFDKHTNENDILEPNMSPFAISYGVYRPQPHGAKVYNNGDMVHCNRFNGPNSDRRHLSHYHPQTYINYYKSDCYYGISKGICTYTNDKCNTNFGYHRGWCSFRQGWSINYHQR